jgi:hypothetical protein
VPRLCKTRQHRSVHYSRTLTRIDFIFQNLQHHCGWVLDIALESFQKFRTNCTYR